MNVGNSDATNNAESETLDNNSAYDSNSAENGVSEHRLRWYQKFGRFANTGDARARFNYWLFYCYLLTFWIPAALLAKCGMREHGRRVAWREKIGLLSIILFLGLFVSFLTFGFNRTICSPVENTRDHKDNFSDTLLMHGKAFNLQLFNHIVVPGISQTTNFMGEPYNYGGYDASFLFQNVNGNCKGLITPKDNCTIPHNDIGDLAWYYPCKILNDVGELIEYSNEMELESHFDGWNCHTSNISREEFYKMNSSVTVTYKWEDLKKQSNKLVVVNGQVLDLSRLDYLDRYNLNYPIHFDEIKTLKLEGYDLSLLYTSEGQKRMLRCLTEITKVGIIDSKTVGCLIADVVLYLSLVIILSIVISKFFFACYFKWVIAKGQGVSKVDNKTFLKELRDIEKWSNNTLEQDQENLNNNIQRSSNNNDDQGNNDFEIETPIKFNEKVEKHFPYLSRIKHVNNKPSTDDNIDISVKGYTTISLQDHFHKVSSSSQCLLKTNSFLNGLNSSISLVPSDKGSTSQLQFEKSLIHKKALVQPDIYFTPFNFPLVYTVCFVTCYSEEAEGIKATLDSLTATDYPGSHKLLMVVCDGLVKGSNNDKTTPEICISMMEDFVIDPTDVEASSYIAVATGRRRHNMAKIYCGYYRYKGNDIKNKDKRLPMVTIVKCGLPEESQDVKPGNRGKRDSQVLMMSFFQKLLFNERMTELEYHLLKGIWQITGTNATFYELILMVDADTKVYPNSISHMVAEMIKDPLIMGLCGETKIVNKAQSWVTMIQVFEYYISHHQTKAFESVFGSVTCLPGCFSMYRLKAPKGTEGFWVPILINPDIVEKYSDNVTNTLHKKNLLLLGEDRYLSSLLLKTHSGRKMVFVPKAACKTMVPDTFKVLLSQRRRWVNSTIHNLFELVLVRDLCGTFCFSMQFFILIELIGTLVLPLAICFTMYIIFFSITSSPTPVITLVLLALILGLPGILVVVTATRISYIMWLGVYILALPIWNFVIPVYAYWKFDDFSWGDTRAVDGETKDNHGDDEGIFDYSNIKLMKLEDHIKLDSNI
ncbi:hypothetical protein TPHA_0M00620 [Tetrapisispora phaffii CBS 4417]|uniref:chitin synthase n=1 Tax=Tetrapisispora phaffii (strain ATCC 24235 / CBS 4417 / NBRC 1672 / NRRL Y-8282 / UCD 70-5) TaxID=1071381 RepID=G8C0C2_TETPH|nr:hypothetical protein TPHA_0M00620 [Tetrapisispora phaffii CBS 4417]CCE65637.1 hypothetical protein TPHA_0M00620 [Tetrapisispora phaffii CBS 4417]